MEINTLLYFLMSSVIITIVPGPDNMYLLALSLGSGVRQGLALTCGLASGVIFHTTLVILGVAVLLQQSPLALQLIKYIGAAYLLYLAWKAFHTTGELHVEGTASKQQFFNIYRRGVLMNTLNPKVLLFFLAYLPQFVSMNDPDMGWHFALLGLIFSLQTLVIFGLIAIGAGKIHDFILSIKNFNRIMGIIQGRLLVLIAGAILLM